LWLYFKAEQVRGKEKVNDSLYSSAICIAGGNPPLDGEGRIFQI
jgi:hypothetical protein